MANGKLTLRNYRCFDWDNPMTLEFGEGFMAIVGSNNSGKSSALRSIYELRPALNRIREAFQHPFHISGPNLIQGISDITELANDNDPGRFKFTLELLTHTIPNGLFHIATSVDFEFTMHSQSLRAIKVVAVNHHNQSMSIDEGMIKELSSIETQTRLKYHNNATIDYTELISFAAELSASKYFPAFRNAINEGAANYYDIPVGTAMVSTWDLWKAGNVRTQKIAISKVENEIASLLGFQSLQINADQTNKTLDVIINNRPHKLYEVGAGVAQLIITLGAALIHNPPYILIDEPELNLHPSLQLHFLTALGSYASKGVVYATHSIGLARSSATCIYALTKNPEQSSRMHVFGDRLPNFSEWLGELSYGNRLELGCEGILLVEGPSDVLCFQEFLRKLGKDHKYVLLQLGGSSMINENIGPHLSELTRLTDPKNIHIYIDSERESGGAKLDPERQGFLEGCKAAKINAQASVRRATENYFDQKSITKALGQGYQSLEPFQKLKEAPKQWSKSSNWRIAREIDFKDIKDTDLGIFLSAL